MSSARRCAQRGLPHGRGVNSLRRNPTDPGAARAAAEVVELLAGAPDVGDGSKEWSVVAWAEEDNIWLLREAGCRVVGHQSLTV